VHSNQPAVVFGRDTVIAEPSPQKVAELLGMSLEIDFQEVVDVLIVGGGPAGVAAAVYAGAEGLSALVIEDVAIGGQAGTSSRIENYMGFPTGISGADLLWRGELQAMKFGTRFAMPHRVTQLERRANGLFCAQIGSHSSSQPNSMSPHREICAKSIVVATGVQYQRLPLARLEEFEGAGVYYAATDMEARACRSSNAIVVGGGNSAGQAAMFLSRFAQHVHVLVRGSSLASSMSDYLLNRLQTDPKITIHLNTAAQELHGQERLQAVTIRDAQTNINSTIDCSGLFLMVGAQPNTAWLSGLVQLDERGFVKTGAAVGEDSPYGTSAPGIFAVGDVRAGSVKRVASAVGEGSVVISKVWEFVQNSNQ
jgi:thioredoxin reductase (NADPH)